MLNDSWTNPWKLTTIGLGLIVATAAATSLVVANRTGKDSDKQTGTRHFDLRVRERAGQSIRRPRRGPSSGAAR